MVVSLGHMECADDAEEAALFGNAYTPPAPSPKSGASPDRIGITAALRMAVRPGSP